MEENSTTVVVFPLPVIGHITPMLHFAASLASRGLEVTFVTTRRTHFKVLRTMSETMPSDIGISLRLVSIQDDLEEQEDSNISGTEAIIEAVISMAKLQGEFERLLEEVIDQERRVSCLVSDFLMEWTAGVAERFRLPRAAFWTSTATFLILMVHGNDLVAEGYLPLRDETKNNFIPYIEGVPQLRARELPIGLQEYCPGDLREIMERNLNASWVVMNTFDKMEKEAIAAARKYVKHELVVLGPLLPISSAVLSSSGNDASRAILKWLDTKNNASVLYISFGTVAGIASMKPIEELAKGLDASGVDFVWVFRSNLVQNKQGEQQFMDEFQQRTQASGKGLIVPWAPQLQVLQHDAVGGFLSHCGWNSVLESVWNGVPMLGWPCMAEQNLNYKFVVEVWKVGVTFETTDSAAVSRGVLKLIRGKEGKEARKNAAKMKAASQAAVMPPGMSYATFDKFAASLRSSV